jgi:hypothetical protein
MTKTGMACEYRATHEFGADGCCNLCFKARLVAEKEQAKLDGPDEPLAPLQSAPIVTSPPLPTGWTSQMNGLPAGGTITFPTEMTWTGNTTKLMPLTELSWLQVQEAHCKVAGTPTPREWTARIAELQAQYYPYTKTGLLEQAAQEAHRKFVEEKQRVCDHRALTLSEDGYEADCALCGKYFDEVELDDLQAERAHLEKVELKTSARLAALLLPRLASELGAALPNLAEQNAALTPDGEHVACECGKTFTMGDWLKHRSEHR